MALNIIFIKLVYNVKTFMSQNLMWKNLNYNDL